MFLTLVIAVIGIATSLPIGILLALGRRSTMPVTKTLCVCFIELIRGVPLISVLFMASIMLPLFLPHATGAPVNETETPASKADAPPIITLDRVHKWYGEFHVLKDINLTVAQGERVVVCVTHEMGFAREAADRVVFMDAGEIVEAADPGTFFSRPKTDRAELFLSQILSH